MPPISGKQRKAQLKLKRAVKRGEAPAKRIQSARNLESQFVRLDKGFLDDTRALAGSIVLRRPIPTHFAVLNSEWITPFAPLTVPKRPKWRYHMSKDELDANEQAYFRTWLAQQDLTIQQWQGALNASPSADLTGDDADDSETRSMPHPPTHFERNIEVWRQFWRVTELSQILLLLLDSRCPPLHLPPSLSAHLNIPVLLQDDPSPRSKQPFRSNAPRIILVLTKVDISGSVRTASWTSFLNANYPGVPVVAVEAYAPKASSTVEQGPIRYEPHLPGTFRERLVRALRDAHEQLLQPPPWLTAPRDGESEEGRLQRIEQWKPRVKKVIDWDGVLKAKGKLVGRAVGGVALPVGEHVKDETEGVRGDDAQISDNEEEQTGETYEWREPEYLTVGVIGQPNVGKSSLLNAIFGRTRVRASRTPGKTKHFQTLFWTSDVRLVDCPGLVMPSFVPMDIQVLSGILPISRISAVSFCVHQVAQLLPLERILDLTHPSLYTASEPNATSGIDRSSAQFSKSKSKSISKQVIIGVTLEEKRTWRPGQRPPEQTKTRLVASRWTASDIMTAYAQKNGWVTAKAGRPDIHRAGNASKYQVVALVQVYIASVTVLRLVGEGKIPWAFWPPGSSAPSQDGIWLKDGVQQQLWDELEVDEDSDEEGGAEQDSEMEEDDIIETDEEEDQPIICGTSLGRFEALSVD